MPRAHVVAFAVALLAPACSHAYAPAPAPAPATVEAEKAGTDLLGTTPPEWDSEHWLNSPPLQLSSLRGKVVLVRWWTAGCPYCSASAPALREFDRAYRDRGLVVVGMYHHKESGPLDYAVVDRTAAKYGFTFPVAIDPDWRTLDRWWAPKTKQRGWTSVTFVLDRHGVIRHVHPGGQYVQGEPAYDAMKSAIEKLVGESG
jgi:peroxiredoxin